MKDNNRENDKLVVQDVIDHPDESVSDITDGQGRSPDGPLGTDEPGIASLRLSQNFAAAVPTRKLLLTVPVRKPGRQEWIQVHPEESMHIDLAIIEDKDLRETLCVRADLQEELLGEWVAKRLYPTITRQGVPFLWPIRLPGPDGRIDEWNRSAAEIADVARTKWVRVVANPSLGAYEALTPQGEFPPAAWPVLSADELVAIAFKGKIIDRADHPFILRLQGRA